jgi:hypothetical protein
MAYFDTKKDSLEEAIKAAVKNEKMDAVNKTAVKKKFDDRKDKDIDNDGDVDASDKYLHKRRKAISKAIKSEDYLDEKNKMNNKEIDFELFSGEKGAKAANMAMNKEIRRASQMKDYKSARAYMDKVQDKYAELGAQDSEPQRTIDAVLGAVFKEEVKKEAFEYGTPEATKNSLNMTPGQSSQEWDEQVGLMHKKQNTMREAIAKMWGVEEGHNPFKEEEKNPKKESKTMTGKPATKVSVNSDEKKD